VGGRIQIVKGTWLTNKVLWHPKHVKMIQIGTRDNQERNEMSIDGR